ncbi:MAG: S24 family peptidase, partial [Syntrophobacteraceae bacterium]
PEGDYYSAPLVEGKIAAGSGGLVEEDQIKSKVWIYAPELLDRRRHRLTAVQVGEVNGISMLPTIAPGDIVLIDHDDPGGAKRLFKSGKIYAIRTSRTEPDTAIKRVYESGENLVIASDNREFAPEVAWSRNVDELIVGRVVWGWRNLLKA